MPSPASPHTATGLPLRCLRAAAIALGWLVAATGLGQGTDPAFRLPWSTVDGGGGTSTDRVHRITGTLGQWGVSTSRAAAPAGTADAPGGIDGGFWPPLAESDPAPPEIQTQPASPPPVPDGGCLTLFVEATGIPLPRYQWRRNGIRLRGATNAFLDLCVTNETIAAAYDVLVFNPLGFVRSDPAVVVLELEPLPSSPDFVLRGTIGGTHGRGTGSNAGGKHAPGEPLHDGRRGGKTAWLVYHATATGILTLDTKGSSFDTLLAVYTGTDPKSLTPIASDDDNGGFYRSRLRHRVVAGQDYQIAIDGRAGESGTYELNWDLLVTEVVPPRFVRQPAGLTVHRGQRAAFSALVEGAGDLQWFHNGKALQDDGRIQGARKATLLVDNARIGDEGEYRLVATTGGIQVDGETATLHLDLSPAGNPVVVGAAAFDKFTDARDDVVPPSAGGNRVAAPARVRPVGLARGGPLLTRTDDYGTSRTDTALCDAPVGATAWFYYQAETNGLVVLDTAGSSYDTVAGVYVDLTGDPENLTSAGCNDDAADGAATSRVIFNANAELLYAVVVGGKEDASGTLVAQVRPAALPRLTAGGFAASGTFEVEAAAEPGLKLVLEYATTLGSAWFPVQTNAIPATGTSTYHLAIGGTTALYFRARPDLSEYPMITISP